MKEEEHPDSTHTVEERPAGFHFDLDGARELLPWLKSRVAELTELGTKGKMAMDVFEVEKAEEYTIRIHQILDEIYSSNIEIKDQSASLFDFPAVINNMPAYICWKSDEEKIEYWHYVDEGFAGRKKFDGSEQILSFL